MTTDNTTCAVSTNRTLGDSSRTSRDKDPFTNIVSDYAMADRRGTPLSTVYVDTASVPYRIIWT